MPAKVGNFTSALLGKIRSAFTDETRTDGFNAVSHSSLYAANHHETIRGLCACLDYGFLIISIIALAGPKLSGRLQTELQALNDAKEAAVAEYQSAE